MKQVKIFNGSNPMEAEEKVNAWLATNPKSASFLSMAITPAAGITVIMYEYEV